MILEQYNVTPEAWLTNDLADSVVTDLSPEFQLAHDKVSLVNFVIARTALILERLTAIAVSITDDESLQQMSTSTVPRASKADLIQDILCTSSHPLLLQPNGSRKCTRCHLVIPASSTVAQYIALEAPCPGKRHIPDILLFKPVDPALVGDDLERDSSLNVNLTFAPDGGKEEP